MKPLTPKKLPKMAAYEPKMAKNALWKIAEPKSKNNYSLFSSIFHVARPVSRYSRLKLKFLCKRIFHCIYSFCSIKLTKTRNTWSLEQQCMAWMSARSIDTIAKVGGIHILSGTAFEFSNSNKQHIMK